MAEYLIQSETLDDIADAVNAKTGGSSAMSPAEMASAITAIPSGGFIVPDSGPCLVKQTFGDAQERAHFSESDITFDFSGMTLDASDMFMLATFPANSTVRIKASAITDTFRMFYVSSGVDHKVQTVYFDTVSPPPYSQRFGHGSLKYVLGTPMKLPATPSGGYGYNTYNIVEIRFVENTVTGNANLGGQYLSNESLVSLANALTAATGVTLTLHANAKTKISNIVGRSERVTADDVTYDRFVSDASGTVTLMDFITNTKGWTVA